MIVVKMGTSGETVRNGSDVEETSFGKDLSSLRMSLAPVIRATDLVNLGHLVLRGQRWYRRRLCRRDYLAGLGHRKRRKKDYGGGPACGSRGAIRASRIVLCLWSHSRRMMVMRDMYE